jgi:hypothetical protein
VPAMAPSGKPYGDLVDLLQDEAAETNGWITGQTAAGPKQAAKITYGDAAALLAWAARTVGWDEQLVSPDRGDSGTLTPMGLLTLLLIDSGAMTSAGKVVPVAQLPQYMRKWAPPQTTVNVWGMVKRAAIEKDDEDSGTNANFGWKRELQSVADVIKEIIERVKRNPPPAPPVKPELPKVPDLTPWVWVIALWLITDRS